jgi:hypothetical protein
VVEQVELAEMAELESLEMVDQERMVVIIKVELDCG